MRIFHGFDEVGTINNAVVTTGSFDGVHIGHKTILNRLKRLADQENGESVLITFDPHPRKVLYPESAGKDLKLINSRDEKLELLEKAGLDNVIIVKFTLEFSKIKSEDFVADYLCRKLKARKIVVGFNHHFGFNKEGDYKQLWNWREKYDFDVEEIPEQEVQHETVSSTKIRLAINEGYIQRANAYLDHYYTIKADTYPFAPEDKIFSIPVFKMLITEECKLIPSCGIYAVSVDSRYKGMVIICRENDCRGEVLLHVLDESFLPGKNTNVSFHKKIHGAVPLKEDTSVRKLEAAISEISELIF